MLSLAGHQRRTLLIAAVMGTAWMLSQAALPLLVGRTLDAGVVEGDGSALLVGCLALIVLGAFSALTGLLRHRLACANWLQAAMRSQQLVGHHVADQGLAIAAATTTGEVVETVATDAPRLADIFEVLARGIGSVITYVAVSVLLLRMDLIVGIWVTVGLPLLAATLATIVRPLQARQKLHRENEGKLTALGADTVAGLRVLRGIGGEQQFLARYDERSQQVRQAGVLMAGPQAVLDAGHVLLPGIFVVVLTWLGAHGAVDGRLSAGDLVTIYGFAAFMRMPLETATEVLSKAVRARVAANRIVAVLQRTDATPADGPTTATMPPSGAVVHDPDSGLTLVPGRLTGLVSADPQEAEQVVDRLAGPGRPRTTQPATTPEPAERGPQAAERGPQTSERGPQTSRPGPQTARLAGVSLADLPLDAVRERILISEAEPRMFSGTLRGELDPYGQHDDAEVLAAIRTADATDVLDALPDGLSTRVEERGRAFSGGQRQRLVLARAVLADPEVLVLVEPTSAVDAHTEARVAQRLRAARIGRTTLVTTASPLLLDLCDQVAFLVGGRVAAEGTHRELLRSSTAYRHVVLRGDDE
jgi:ABC-type multidrug transport system fused ATPase/permease subunit